MPYADPEEKKENRKWRIARNEQAVFTAKIFCIDCGRSDLHPDLMILSHTRGEFGFWIGRGRVDCSELRLRAEIAKCDPLCPNCRAARRLKSEDTARQF